MECTRKDCRDCLGTISTHLMLSPEEFIIPNPNLCQDAAWIAFVLDKRLEKIRDLVGL